MTRRVSRLEAQVEREMERLVAVGAFSDLRRQVPHEMFIALGGLWLVCSCSCEVLPPGAESFARVVVDFEVTGPDGDTLTLDAKGYSCRNQALPYKLFAKIHRRNIIPIASASALVDFAPVMTATRPGGISLVTSAPRRRNRRK